MKEAATTPSGEDRRPRGTRPDAIDGNRFVLIKGCKVLRATYQIRLLVFFAEKEDKVLELVVRKDAIMHKTIRDLKEKFPRRIRLVREFDFGALSDDL